MQTFLPFESFAGSAESLDTRRLGKQRVEVIQIVRALTVPTYGWKNHPATLMWEGYEEALGRYGLEVVRAWRERGFEDSCEATIVGDLAIAGVPAPRTQDDLVTVGALPPWLGDEAFHRSHQSSLLRKDPAWYGPRFPDVPDDLDYVWPVRSPKVLAAEAARAARAEARAIADAVATSRRRGGRRRRSTR